MSADLYAGLVLGFLLITIGFVVNRQLAWQRETSDN